MEAAASDSQPSGAETFADKNAKHFEYGLPSSAPRPLNPNEMSYAPLTSPLPHHSKVAGPGGWPQWVLDLHTQIIGFLTSPEFPAWANMASPPPAAGRRMLDYACGDGLVSRALKPLFTQVVGVDVSGKMLDKYRAAASQRGLGPPDMVGVRGEFVSGDAEAPTDPPLPEGDAWDFDLVALSMALHHVEDPAAALRRLAARLRVGGKLLVVDWTPLDGSTPAQRAYQGEVRRRNDEERITRELQAHAASHTVSKPNGFTEREMGELFAQAGCEDMKWRLAEELSYVPVVRAKGQLYWAIATRTS